MNFCSYPLPIVSISLYIYFFIQKNYLHISSITLCHILQIALQVYSFIFWLYGILNVSVVDFINFPFMASKFSDFLKRANPILRLNTLSFISSYFKVLFVYLCFNLCEIYCLQCEARGL